MSNIAAALPDGVVIREFRADDRARVTDFFDRMGGESRALFNRNDCNRIGAMRFFDDPIPHRVDFLAEYEGRMVGFVFLRDTDRGVAWLGIAVADDFKGRHLGRILLTKARECASAHGCGGIMLMTHPANFRAQALYENFGFERVGTHTSGEFLYLLRF